MRTIKVDKESLGSDNSFCQELVMNDSYIGH